MNRRETFTAPLALAALAAPSFAGASTESEILRMYVEWTRAKHACNCADMDALDFDEAFAALLALEDRIISTPAATVAELAAKVLVADDGGDMGSVSLSAEKLVAEMRSLVVSADAPKEV